MVCNELILFIIFGCSFAKGEEHHHNNSDTLYLVHVLFRHGDRTPQRSYPKDIYKNETYYPYGYGELTNKGKFRMYNVGLSLRNRYEKFWGGIYNQRKIEARSSSYSRTRMSCELVMAAMFQPNSEEKWNPELNWQPTVCDYVPAEEDYVFLTERNCRKLSTFKQNEIEKDRIMGKFDKYKNLFSYLSKQSGLKIETPSDVTALYDILRCQSEMGMKLPKWTHDVFPYPMSNLSVLDWDYTGKNDELKTLSGGVLFKKIVDNTKQKMNDTSNFKDRKVYLYSGHDSNIVPILEILNIYQRQIMPYGAAVIFEIHHINRKFIVKVFYQDHSTRDPQLRELPDCGKNCTFEKFFSVYRKYFGIKEMCNTFIERVKE